MIRRRLAILLLLAPGLWPVSAGLSAAAEPVIASAGWSAGRHYVEINPPQATHVRKDRIEVLEIFWYGCRHCNELESHLGRWLAAKPYYVEFVRVPVLWKPARQHARLFYTLQALNRSDLHSEVFATIFERGNFLSARDDAQSLALQAQFAQTHGIPAEKFIEMYNSPLIDGYLQRADEIARRYEIAGVPTIIVNGKYLSDDDRAGGKESLVALTRYLTIGEWNRTNGTPVAATP